MSGRLVPALLVLLTAACAARPRATETTRSIINSGGSLTRRTENGIPAAFDASRDSVWAALLAAYRDVGLEPDVVDTDASVVARTKLPIRRVFNGRRVSALFSCGETPTGTSLADVGQVVTSVRSQIGGAPDHPVVYTLVDAYVIPDGGGSSSGLHCGSSGTIEGWLQERVRAHLSAR